MKKFLNHLKITELSLKSSTALSFTIVLAIQKCCYFIASIQEIFLHVYDFLSDFIVWEYNSKNLLSILTHQLGQLEKMRSTQLGKESSLFVRIGNSLIINSSFIYYTMIEKQKLTLSDVERFDYSVTASKEALKQLKELIEKED